MATPSFQITVRTQFSAALSLPELAGPCSQLHGYRFEISVDLTGSTLNEQGLLGDGNQLKRALDQLIQPLDRSHLNQHPDFHKKSPSCEHLAQWIAQKLPHYLPKTLTILRVSIDTGNHYVIHYHPTH